ncbi:PcfJ domain-containing protein [Cereibacter sphaeroides]|uniref:PcfJ domain-containing protein n=1 Tax=Cereibacter sphaeroides TaxID=1063 RepID=UPI001F4914C4|nr:PcfJ domain-containing protein [Cereibacter sphaeroides]MCE6959675.1 PcfJ domain-containing protein [Cereibacter sphaeroides]MCE6974464.1 PcfJ domain-containing protein [Cereibacter sphaeroides]
MFDIVHRIQDHLKRGFTRLLPGDPEAGVSFGDAADMADIDGDIAEVGDFAEMPAFDVKTHDGEPVAEPTSIPDWIDVPGDHTRFTFLKTVLGKVPYSEAQIDEIQRRYDFAVRHGRTWMSRQGEVEGWRRVALVGIGRGMHRLMGVTDAGLFVVAEVSFSGEERQLEWLRDDYAGSAIWRRTGGGRRTEMTQLIGPLPSEVRQPSRLRMDPREIARRFLDPDDPEIQRTGYYLAQQWTFNTRAKAFREMIDGMTMLKTRPFRLLPYPDHETNRMWTSPRPKGKLVGMISWSSRKKIERILYSLWRELDPEVRHLMRSTLAMSGADAQWFAGCSFQETDMLPPANAVTPLVAQDPIGGDPLVAIARRQAVRAFPILSEAMKWNPNLLGVIDRREPLVPALARELGTTVEMIHALRGLTWQRAACKPGRPPLDAFRAIQPAELPKNRRGFRALAALGQYATSAGIDPDVLRRRARGRYEEALHQLGRVDAAGMKDHLDDLFKRLVIPAVLARHPESFGQILKEGWGDRLEIGWEVQTEKKAFAMRCFEQMSFKDIVEANIGWHRNLGHIERDVGVDVKACHWTPLVGTLTTEANLTIREITSLADLRLQGKLEHHCVGTYGMKVTRWEGGADPLTLIVSIEQDGRVLSTAEIAIKAERKADPETGRAAEKLSVGEVRVVQNQARGNGPAPVETRAALDAFQGYLSSLHEGALEAHAAGLAAWKKSPRNDLLSSAAEALEADIDRPDYLETAWQHYAPLLPRAVRKAGLDHFLDTPLLRETVRVLTDDRAPAWQAAGIDLDDAIPG